MIKLLTGTSPPFSSHQASKFSLCKRDNIRVRLTGLGHLQKNSLRNFVGQHRWLAIIRMNFDAHRPLGTVAVTQHVGDDASTLFGFGRVETKQCALDADDGDLLAQALELPSLVDLGHALPSLVIVLAHENFYALSSVISSSVLPLARYHDYTLAADGVALKAVDSL